MDISTGHISTIAKDTPRAFKVAAGFFFCVEQRRCDFQVKKSCDFGQNVDQFGARLKPFLFKSTSLELFQNIPPAYGFKLVLLSQHYLVMFWKLLGIENSHR